MASDTSPSCLLRWVVAAREEAGRGKKTPILVLGHFWTSDKSTILMGVFVGPCSVGVCPCPELLSWCKSRVTKLPWILVGGGQEDLWGVDLNSAFWSLQFFLWK